MKEKTPLILATFLITLMAIANLMRLLWNIPVTIGTFTLPGWTGSIFFLVLGLLSAWSFRSLCFDFRAIPSIREKEAESLRPSALTVKQNENHENLR